MAVLGNGIVLTALLLQFHDSGAGGLVIAGLLAAGAAPIVLLAPLAGQVVDRFDSRSLIIISSLWQSATCLLLAFVVHTGTVLVLVVLNAMGTAVIVPAFAALTPLLVPDRQLSAATSVQQGGHSAALLAGQPLGGLLAGVTGGSRVPLLIAAVTFLVTIVPALLIGTRRQPAPTDRLRRMRTGNALFYGIAATVTTLAILLVLTVQIAGVAAVFLIRDTFQASALAYGMFTGAYAAGILVGTAVSGLLPTARRILLAVPLLAAAAGACFVGIGLSSSLVAIFALYLVAGIGGGVVGGATVTLLLLSTPKSASGRVLAGYAGLVRAAALVAYGLGGLIVGPLAPQSVYLLSGIVALAAVLATAPAFRKARMGLRA